MIKVEEAWEIIRSNADKAQLAYAVWHSAKRHTPYEIANTRKDSIGIHRKDKQIIETLTKAVVEQKAKKLLDAGGRIPVGQLISSTSKETAFVYFHHQLTWSEDLNFIEVIH